MLNLFLAELRRVWIQFRRYPGEAIGGIIAITSLFYGLFLGTRYVAGPGFQFGERLDAIIIGYVLWTLVLFVIFDIASNLQIESQIGTLEQVFLSPFGAAKVFLVRALAGLSLNLTLNLGILVIILILTGSRLYFPLTLILPLITVVLAAYGLAFTLGSLALLLKRVQQLLSLFQFGLLFLIAAPTETWQGPLRILGLLLPMTTGAGILRDLMARGEPLDLARAALALLNGIAYFALGLAIFRACEREAKRRGVLGGY